MQVLDPGRENWIEVVGTVQLTPRGIWLMEHGTQRSATAPFESITAVSIGVADAADRQARAFVFEDGGDVVIESQTNDGGVIVVHPDAASRADTWRAAIVKWAQLAS